MGFEVGVSGNPAGRPKGSYGGRIQALAGLDKLLARKKNQKALIAALEKDLLAGDCQPPFRSLVGDPQNSVVAPASGIYKAGVSRAESLKFCGWVTKLAPRRHS